MTVSNKQLQRIGPFSAGIDNRSRETELVADDDGNTIAARELSNVDLTSRGTPLTRPGYRKVVECASGHSLWSDPFLPFALFVDAGSMYAMEEGRDPFLVRAGLSSTDVSYNHVAGKAYWSNGIQSGVVLPDGQAMSWGVESPSHQPAVAASIDGDVRWQVAVTFKRSDGEESGTGLATLVLGSRDAKLTLTNFPTPLDPEVTIIRVWVSGADGDDLHFNRDVPVGMSTVTIDPQRRLKALDTQFLEPMFPGHIVRHLNGRTYVAEGPNVRWSEPQRPGLTKATDNQLRVGSEIRLMEPVGHGSDSAGLFVSDQSRTYWLGGNDPFKFNRQIAHKVPAIRGTGITVPGSLFGLDTTIPVAYWINAQGTACVGLPGGTVVEQRRTSAASPLAQMGASLLREQDGMSRIITTLRHAEKNRFAVSDSVSIRVYRDDDCPPQ